MKKTRFLYFLFIFISFTEFSYAELKVAFIDMNLVLNNSNLGKSVLNKINEIDKKNIKNLKLREEEIKKLEIEYKEKQNLLAKEALVNEAKKINDKIINFRKEKEAMVKQINEIKNVELKKFYEKINPVLDDYVNEKNIDLVLDIKVIIMGKSKLNFTQDFINLINEQFPI